MKNYRLNYIITSLAKTLFLSFCLFILQTNLFSQVNNDSFLELRLSVEYEKEALTNAKILLQENGKIIRNTQTDLKGKTKFALKFNSLYILKISKDKLVSQKIEINTKLREGISGEFIYPLEISLFETIEGLNTSIFESPIVRIKYIEKLGDFDIDEAYTKTMQEEVSKIESQLLAIKKANYDREIKNGDRLMIEKKYEESETAYWNALEYFPNESYPKVKLLQIKKFVKKDEKYDELYNKNIATADEYYNAKQYRLAKKMYQRALIYKPKETYPENKINKIDEIFSKKTKSKNKFSVEHKKYKQLISDGNIALKKKEYEKAKKKFLDASKIKTEASYPRQQLDKIRQIISENKNEIKFNRDLNEKYKESLTKADVLFGKKEYKKAKKQYKKALKIKSDELYPKNKIIEIDKLIFEKINKLTGYDYMVAAAEQYVEVGNYNSAIKSYEQAIRLRPKEVHIKGKIDEVKKLAKSKTKKRADTEYKKAMDNGDMFLEKKDYRKAKLFYEKAKKIKPNNTKNIDIKIKKLDGFIDLKEANAEETRVKEMKYRIKVKYAYKMFGEKKYKASKNAYKKALEIFPNREVPKKKIKEINKFLRKKREEEEQKKMIEKNYQMYLRKADSAFSVKAHDKAKSFYEAALNIKPNNKSLQLRVSETQDIIIGNARREAILEQREKEYQQKIDLAEEFFANGIYEDAKALYQQALEINSKSSKAMMEIEKLIPIIAKIKEEQEKEKQISEEYNEVLEEANDFFKEESYFEAQIAYERAEKLVPTSFTKNRIIEISNLIAVEQNEAKRTEFYDKELRKAENVFKMKKYKDAKIYYEKALLLKKGDKLAKDKIAELNILIKKQEVKEKEKQESERTYLAYITKANQFLLANQYNDARQHYEMALKIKPKEKVPQEKLKIIKNIKVKEKKAKEEKTIKESSFRNLVNQADILFYEKSFDESKMKYLAALKLNPNASHIKIQLEKIKKIKRLEKDAEKDAWKDEQRQKVEQAIAKRKELESQELDEQAKRIAESKRLSELAKNYPEGVTKEVIVTEKKTIIIIVVNRNSIAYEYKKVIHAWGSQPVCLRNGLNISISTFKNETKVKEGEKLMKIGD